MQTLDLVFQGGGAKGLALNGAMKTLFDADYEVGRVVGTSAGSMTACLVAAGLKGDALVDISLARTPSGDSEMSCFLEKPGDFDDTELGGTPIGELLQRLDLPLVPNWVEQRVDRWILEGLVQVPWGANFTALFSRGGFFSAAGLIQWLCDNLNRASPGLAGSTLAEFYDRTGTDFTAVASDIDATQMLVLNHRTAPGLPIEIAVRMSSNIPALWEEVLWKSEWGTYMGEDLTGHSVVDGGVVSNFPLILLLSDDPWVIQRMGDHPSDERHVAGLALDDQIQVANAPSRVSTGEHLGLPAVHGRILARIEKVLDTALGAHDMAEVRRYPTAIAHLPVGGYGTIEFHMSALRARALVESGTRAMQTWLSTHGTQTRQSVARMIDGADHSLTR